MKNLTTKFLKERDGVTAIEYGLIAGLIAVVIAASIGPVGTQLKTIFDNILAALTPQ
jgi:pilus assembly protein Flp/PilA